MTNTYHHGDLKNTLIKTGIEILSNEGVKGLSLRRVAKRAGVSHTAPYAHFSDKQALVAAISTEGYKKLYAQLTLIDLEYSRDPLNKLIEVAWCYIHFAVNDPAHFKITFSGVIEKEMDYPAFVELSQQSFSFIIKLVTDCQAAGILRPGPPDFNRRSHLGSGSRLGNFIDRRSIITHSSRNLFFEENGYLNTQFDNR